MLLVHHPDTAGYLVPPLIYSPNKFSGPVNLKTHLIKTMRITKLILALLGACLFFFTCTSPEVITEAPTSVVKPPIPHIDPAFETHRLLAEEGGTWTLPSGTSLRIPPDAFVDEAGQLVKGAVDLKYRELHDGFHIYLSGIPLETSGGQLTTAGTFEVRAQQAGATLALQECAAVEVRMASFEGGDDYDFYQFDEYSGAWNNQGTREPEINVEKKKLRRKIARMTPSLRFPLNRKYMAFNYQAILDIFFNNDWKKMQEDQSLPGKLEQYGLGWTEAEVHQRIQWKSQEVHAALMVWKNLSGKTFPAWTKGRYGKLENIKRDQYRYHVANKDSTEFFSVKLLAVMDLKSLFAFPPEKWKNDYLATMKKVEAEQERLKTMAEVFRTFEVEQMGIFNWDRLRKEEQTVFLTGKFSVEENLENPLTDLMMIYIPGDNRSVYKIPKDRWDEMNLGPDDKGRIFCLLPDNQIGLFSSAKYRKIDFAALKKMEKPEYYFEMEVKDLVINTKDDLAGMLALQ